ncbi:MAG: CopG family transcriptional regulator [Nitrospirota bacterium]
MRTTINLPDELLAQIKKLAATSRSTITALIEDALHEALARRRRTRRHERVILRTYGKQGLLPGVDIDDTASVLDLMESSVGPPRR